MASLSLGLFSPPRRGSFCRFFFFRLRHFSREFAKASLFPLTNVLPLMVYYNSVSAEVDGIKESREILELPEKCGTSEQRKQRKEVRRRGGAKTAKRFCVQGEKIML